MTGYISIRIEFGSTEQKPDYSNLIRGLANSFYKEPDSKCFLVFCKPYSLCHNYPTLLL